MAPDAGDLFAATLSRRAFLGGLGLAAGGLVLTACGAAGSATTTATIEAELLGILDLTGPLAPVGRQMAAGAALAIADINNSGGVLGRHVSLTLQDSGSDPQRFSRIAEVTEQSARHKAVLIGPLGQIPGNARLTYLRAGPDLGAPYSPRELRSASSLATQLTVLGRYARAKSASRLHLLLPDVPWLEATSFSAAVARSSGLQVVGATTTSLRQASFTQALDEIGRSGADCVLCLTPGVPQVSLFEQVAASPLQGRVLLLSPTFGAGAEQAHAGPHSVSVVVAQPYFAGMPGADATWLSSVASRVQDGGAVGESAASAWLAWQAWGATIRKSGSWDSVVQAGTTTTIAAPEGKAIGDTALHRVRRTVVLGVADGKGGFDVDSSYATEDTVPASAQPGSTS